MRRLRTVVDHSDLVLCALMALTAIGVTLVDASPVVRTAFAIPLVLFLPGYAFVTALFPGRAPPAVERLLLAVGSSFAVTIMAGLLLAASGIGLSPASWAVTLGSFTLAACAIAWTRRVRRGIFGPGVAVATMPRKGAFMVFVAALLVADVLLGSRLIAGQQEAPPPAQLWLAPISGRPNDAFIGVRAGATAEDYRLVISAAGKPIYEFDVPLTAGERWERNVNFAPELRALPIVARLYEGTSEVESRFVVLQPETDGS
jgi:hypothetical protein